MKRSIYYYLLLTAIVAGIYLACKQNQKARERPEFIIDTKDALWLCPKGDSIFWLMSYFTGNDSSNSYSFGGVKYYSQNWKMADTLYGLKNVPFYVIIAGKDTTRIATISTRDTLWLNPCPVFPNNKHIDVLNQY